MTKWVFLLQGIFLFECPVFAQTTTSRPDIAAVARDVISRSISPAIASRVDLEPLRAPVNNPSYRYEVKNGRLVIRGSSVVALCHGFYDYLKTSDQGMITWSGKNLQIASPWKFAQSKQVVSPYRYHYYMNVVTHGYSTPYWGWDRWQQELDWMALHGMDMLMLNDAYEAIMFRVFRKIGIPENAISRFFTGPAFEPWNRMGNVAGWDGTPPDAWYTRQISLAHQVLTRMKEMGMTPIIQSFAGFVPEEITKVYPSAKITPLVWISAFPQRNRCNILLPDSSNAGLFINIGKLFVREWEKEFGKGEYFLADCFNEMQVPKAADEPEEHFQQRLAQYGKVVYASLKEGDTAAVWTMQGWTFGYKRADWSRDRLAALVSEIPDNKVLFLDLANEYNLNFWHSSPNWQYYQGFFHKQWIYSFIPNMGGKTPWNDIVKTYAEAPIDGLDYPEKGQLIGFGFAPEGIENNELIYELLSDMGWRHQKMNVDDWLRDYCIQRYGSYPEKMSEAYRCFLRSCYGTFTDHPKFRYQMSADGKEAGTVNNDSLFFEGVRYFLSCSDSMKRSELYKNDAIELSAQYISLAADALIKRSLGERGEGRYRTLDTVYRDLDEADRLLQSHPEDRLKRWVDYARAFGNSPAEQRYYAEDARRILTIWGPGVDDYAARMWSGLIASYYVGRMKALYDAERDHRPFDLAAWEENWVKTGPAETLQPFGDPLAAAKKLIDRLPPRH